MNAMQVFKFHESEIRITDDNGEPWFVAMDVCAALGLKQPTKAVSRLDDDEVNRIHLENSRGRKQKSIIVNESGLFSLILRSDKESAKPFRRWVTKVVLPTIRKTGRFEIAQSISRAETKAQRREFTDVLKAHGYTNRYHYSNTTTGMKKQLGIDPKKKKDTFSTQEYGAVFFAEMLAGNTIHASEAIGYHAVNPIAQNAAASVKAMIEQSRRPALGAV